MKMALCFKEWLNRLLFEDRQKRKLPETLINVFFVEETVLIGGNTFTHKDQIKAICRGRARFNPTAKAWEVPEEFVPQLLKLPGLRVLGQPEPAFSGQKAGIAQVEKVPVKSPDQSSSQTKPTVAQAQPPTTASGLLSKWIWARAVAEVPVAENSYHLSKLEPGMDIAVAKKDDANWYFAVMSNIKSNLWAKGVIPAEAVKTKIKSVDYNGQKVLAETLDKLLVLAKKAIKEASETKGEQQYPVPDIVRPDHIRYRIPPNMLTGEQHAVEMAFLHPEKKNLIMGALAGTGKTTMMKHLGSLVQEDEKWQYLAFNVKNEQEGQKKLPGDVPSSTTHKYFGQIVNKNAPNIPADKDKDYKVVADSSVVDIPGEVPKSKRFPIQKLAAKLMALAKNYAVDPRDPEQARKQIEQIVEKYDLDLDLSDANYNWGEKIDYPAIIIDAALAALRESFYELPYDGQGQPKQCSACGGSGTINGHDQCPNCKGKGKTRRGRYGGASNYDDVLWWSALFDHWKMPKLDVVLADEVQDFNACQIKILKKLAENGARLVIVGDKNQAIYGFRGADHEAFQILRDMLKQVGNGGEELTLSTNFRCGSEIIKFVKEEMGASLPDAEQLRSPEKDGDGFKWHKGEVIHDHTYGQLLTMIHEEFKKNNKLLMPTMILCRTNGPLVKTAFNLIKLSIPVKVAGNDIARSLKDIIYDITKKQNLDIDDFRSRLTNIYEQRKSKYEDKIEHSQKLSDLTDNYDSINIICDDNEDIHDTNGLIAKIDAYFANSEIDESDKDKKVILSSGHRAKGLEVERVIIIRYDLTPHPRATTPMEKTQEYNTKYVMLTRAMLQMYISSDKEPKGKHEK